MAEPTQQPNLANGPELPLTSRTWAVIVAMGVLIGLAAAFPDGGVSR